MQRKENTGNSYWRGRDITVDLNVLSRSYQLLLNLKQKIPFNRRSYHPRRSTVQSLPLK